MVESGQGYLFFMNILECVTLFCFILILTGRVLTHFSESSNQILLKDSISDAKILKQKRRNPTKVIHNVGIVLDCS